jgi:hypothetical protein
MKERRQEKGKGIEGWEGTMGGGGTEEILDENGGGGG